MQKILLSSSFILFYSILIAQPLRFFDKIDTVQYTSIDVTGDDKGGWLTLGSALDSSFSIIQFDYCGEVIVNEKYNLPANTKLTTPQLIYLGRDTLLVIATLESATRSDILLFYSVAGIISNGRLISGGSAAVNFNPVISVLDHNNILLGFNYLSRGISKARIVKFDKTLNLRWSKHIENQSELRWIKALSDTTYALGEGRQVHLFDTLGNNLWTRVFEEHALVFNSVLTLDSQLVFLADYTIIDTAKKTHFKQVICLDQHGNKLWESDLIRGLKTPYQLEYNSRLFFSNKLDIVVNTLDTLSGDPIPAWFAYTIDSMGQVGEGRYWSLKDSVIDYKTTQNNEGNYIICAAFGNSDTLRGFASIKSTKIFEGACETKDSAILDNKSVFMLNASVPDLTDSAVNIRNLAITGHSDSFKIERVCEIFDLKDGETPVQLCRGDSVFIAGLNIRNATYQWDNGSKEPGIWVKTAGKYLVNITYCERTITITYNVTYISYADRLDTIESCEYPLTLDAFSGRDDAKYLWSTGDTSRYFTAQEPGTYVVNVTQCEMTFKITFRVLNKTFADKTHPFEFCEYPWPIWAFQGPGITGVTYKWDDGSTDGVRYITGPGTYKVTVDYCKSTFVETFEIKYKKFFDQQHTFNNCAKYPDTLWAYQGFGINNVIYNWDNGETGPYRIINKPGRYNVRINYCNSTFTWSWDVTSMDFVELQFPNVVLPNGQFMENHVFKPYIKESMEVTGYELKLFNRWGKMIFESEVLNNGWDGTYKGEPAPMDTYMYIATMLTKCGEKKYKGTVTLVR